MSQLEHVGTLYVENQRLLAEYGKLLGLIQQIKTGEVAADQIDIDLANQSWSLAMTGKQFAETLAGKT